MLKYLLVVAAIAVAAPAAADSRSQLEGAAGIPPAERGIYSIEQLRYILAVQNRKELSEGRKQAKIDLIKKGRTLGISF